MLFQHVIEEEEFEESNVEQSRLFSSQYSSIESTGAPRFSCLTGLNELNEELS